MSDFHGSDDVAPPEAMIAAAMVPGHQLGTRRGHERLAACPNCAAAFAPEAPMPSFCPACGQAAVLHPPSVAEFAHEFAGHYVAVDGPLWRTLRLLVARPGELTHEYLRGRRRRYVLPLRLYLSASFLFFLAFRLLPSGAETSPADAARAGGRSAVHVSASSRPAVASSGAQEARAAIRAATAAARARLASSPELSASARADRLARLDRLDSIDEREIEDAAKNHRVIVPEGVDAEKPFDCDAGSGRWCTWLRGEAQHVIHRWRTDPEGAQTEFSMHWFGSAPYAVFFMQPVFAGIVGLAYRRRRMLFGEHLVFTMHLHAFWFIAGLAWLLLPAGAGIYVALGVFAYTLLALRHVYGGRWLPTFGRATFIASVYGVLLGVASLVITILAALH
jgi:hypothetical protein